MKTALYLASQYECAVIPAGKVAADYFNMTPDKFLRKVSAGEISLPLIRMGDSQRSAKGVHVDDLAAFIDARRADAIKENRSLCG
ncbi:MAG: pyocin activator PrtN family protein [Alphaproteobacteria bacterium]|nr:pyocin activator PrtN family protein [Alphaproteobacteria bacterium]